MNIPKEIKKLDVGKVNRNVSYKEITTYKMEGKALCLVRPKTIKKLTKLINFIKKNELKYKVIGNGSNLIFVNEFYDGVLIKLNELDKLSINGTKIVVGAGYSLSKLANKTINLGLVGLDFADGIPGTIGGAVYMNAGAYLSDMGYVVSEIKVLTPDLEVKTMFNKDLQFKYRTSFLQKNPGYICLEATIILKKGKREALIALKEDRRKRRFMSQPLDMPSAGSVFRNPKGDAAGRIIEELGFKGKRVGGAMVSPKHANFIVNKKDAKGEDIVKLINKVRDEVKDKYDIELKLEQEIVE